jgi:hypothetical protein
MQEENSGALDGLVSPCGHRNRSRAHFCAACGLWLPMRCPRCSAINRRQANFCNSCHIGLADEPRAHAAPAALPLHAATGSSPARESQSPAGHPGPFEPAKRTVDGGVDQPDSDVPVTRAPQSDKELLADEDAQRLREITRFTQQRRRRAWVRRGIVSVSIAIALLGAVLVSTRSATPTVGPPAVIVGLQGDIATSAGPSQSAAIAQATLASALDVMFQPARQEDTPAAAGTDKSPAFALTQDRAGDKLTVAARSEPPSYEVRMAKTIALIRPAAPHSNTLLPNSTMLSPGDRHAGSVLSVGPDSVVVHEVGRAGEEHKLHVSITRKTRIIESRRNPAISDAQDSFTDEAISLADVNKGDYVIVRASREGANLVATSVTVTRRPETKIVRPGSDSAAPPTTLAIERRKQSSAPTVSATGPAQPAASDGQDSQAVIEWLFSPASVPTQ